jgi:hypothetical protein
MIVCIPPWPPFRVSLSHPHPCECDCDEPLLHSTRWRSSTTLRHSIQFLSHGSYPVYPDPTRTRGFLGPCHANDSHCPTTTSFRRPVTAGLGFMHRRRPSLLEATRFRAPPLLGRSGWCRRSHRSIPGRARVSRGRSFGGAVSSASAFRFTRRCDGQCWKRRVNIAILMVVCHGVLGRYEWNTRAKQKSFLVAGRR